MRNSMSLGSGFLTHLEELEGREAFVYNDEAGIPTIGLGHALTKSELFSGYVVIGSNKVKYANGLTNQQIDALAKQDAYAAVKAVNKYVTVKLTQNQFDALVSFTYNVGAEALRKSTLLTELNKGNYDAVPAQMRRWVKVTKNGVRVVSKGLVNRREKEIKLWLL